MKLPILFLPAFLSLLPLHGTAQEAAIPSEKAASAPVSEPGFVSIFDGQSLKGWHISAKSGHSGTTKNTSGGRWVVENGAITGSQDVPGNGGLIVTDQTYGDFEVALEMNNDFGPDSGLFLRSTEDGKAWQAMIDYHSGGNLMGIYGEGLGGVPHVRNYNFADKVTEIEAKNTGEPPVALPVRPESWSYFWRAGVWNELRARIEGNPPHITTWINGVKIMEWQEKEVRHQEKGGIALQVHGGGDFTKQFVRYRNIRVKDLTGKKTGAVGTKEEVSRLEKEIAASLPEKNRPRQKELVITVQADGRPGMDGKTLAGGELEASLKSAAKLDTKVPIIIHAEKEAKYDSIMSVLDAAHAAGLYSVSLRVKAGKD